MADSSTERISLPLPIAVLAAAVLLTAHSQLTLRHLALYGAGVRYGKIDSAEAAAATPEQTVVHDAHGVFAPDALAGDQLWIGDSVAFTVVGNTATTITLAMPVEEVRGLLAVTSWYYTGFPEKSALVHLAMACPKVNLTVSDLLLGLLFWAVVGVHLWRRQRPVVWMPPVSVLVFLAVCAASAVTPLRLIDHAYMDLPVDLKMAVKELIQYLEVWGVGWLVFTVVLADARCRRWALGGLALGFILTLVVGLAEYITVLRGHSLRGLADIGAIDALFGIRYNPGRSSLAGTEAGKNVLAMYLALCLPLLLAWLTGCRDRRVWPPVALAGLLGIACILHAGLLFCALLGCLAVASLQSRGWWRAAVVAGFAGAVIITSLLTRQHDKILADSIALHRSQDTYGLQPMPMTGQGATTIKRWEPWQQKYVEMQAATSALWSSPFIGYGIGNYQLRINAFFSMAPVPGMSVRKEARNFMERDAHGLFWVQAVETGLLGLLALLWVLSDVLRAAARRLRATTPSDRALAAGVLGAVVVLLVGGWMGSFMVRGLQLIGVALLALPFALPEPSE